MAPILTPQAIEILRRACKSNKTLAAAMKDPRALLARHGIKLPDDVELRIYQRKGGSKKKHDAPNMADAMLTRDFDKIVQLGEISPALDAWWRSTHGGCPFPTWPYTTTKKVFVCDVWGVYAGPIEWVQDVPGTSFGHWTYPNAQTVCLRGHEVLQTVTECLPNITISP
ncbi:MAG TPA: hypothetical protein VER58_06940 [Thermoanaerobaculia bacterium]|nr:hypothetical protein [Thermoanaerobaculia bacterium]